MTDAHNPAVAVTYTTDDIKRLLIGDLTVAEIATRTHWPRQRITAVINGVKGWMLDPKTDMVYQPGNKHMTPTLPDGVFSVPETIAPSPGHEPFRKSNGQQPAEPPLGLKTKGAPAADPEVRKPDKLMDAIATMLGLLGSHTDPFITKDVQRARDALARLRSTLLDSAERRQAEADLAAAEQALAAAKARLKDLKGGKPTTAPATSATDREYNRGVRTWAAEHGVSCPKAGRIPRTVIAAYEAALTQEGTPA